MSLQEEQISGSCLKQTSSEDTIEYAAPGMQRTKDDGKSHICPRTETVAALAAKLDKYRVVNARGTRETGKTTLAELLASYYRGRGEQVILATGWKEVTDPVQYLVDLGNHQGCQGMDYSSFADSNVVVILDQAHHSYPDLTLWLGFIKTQSGRSNGPRICLFSLFGSPTTGRTVYPEGTSPVYFTPEQRVNLATTEPYLYFTRAEYDDVVDRLYLKSMSGIEIR